MAALNGDASGLTVKLSNEATQSLAVGEDPSSTTSNLQEEESGEEDINQKELPDDLPSFLATFREGAPHHMRGVFSKWVEYDDLMQNFSKVCTEFNLFFLEIKKLNPTSEVRRRSLHALGNLNGLWSFPFKKDALEILALNERADLIEQLSTNPALEICGIWLEGNMTNDTAKVIGNAPNLINVILYGVDDLHADEVDVLAGALVRGAASLEYLDIALRANPGAAWWRKRNGWLDTSGWRKRKGWLELLRIVFTGTDCNRSIKKLSLTMDQDMRMDSEMGEFLPRLLTQLLTLNESLQHIRIVYRYDFFLTMTRVTRGGWEVDVSMQINSPPRAFDESHQIMNLQVENLFNSLRYNTSVFSIRLIRMGNANLTLSKTLDKTLTDLLQVNSTLRSINWNLPDGKQQPIDAVLARNARLESYFAILKSARLPFNIPRVGRLFICGYSYAGKTQLRTTMMRIVRNESKFGKWIRDAKSLWRTKGIEVESLRNDEEMQIAIWDMAGHHIFQALQDLLFPQAPQPSIFLFVFSPFDRVGKKNKRQIKREPELSLGKELREWLRFIISNSQRTGHSRQQVLVVLTHRDLIKSKNYNPEWARRTVTALREEFQDVIELLPELDVDSFYLDATSRVDVNPVLREVLGLFKTQFKERFQAVPEVCVELSSLLARDHLDIPSFPICNLEDFHTFCLAKVDILKRLEEELEDSKLRDVLNAITSYLHDVGSIVLIPYSHLVVVSPNWLSHAFLGELIARGHNFQAQPYDHVNADGSPTPNTDHFSQSGFVSEFVLEEILQTIVDKEMQSKRKPVSMEVLKTLLVHLDLSFKVDDGHGPLKTQYFIPHIVRKGETDANLRLSWSSAATGKHHYLGFRLQCEDGRTSLTSIFFARLQITLRRKLKDAANVHVTCSRGYVQFMIDGHEIIVEQRQPHEIVQNHVDILVKGSESKFPDATRQFVMIKIIDEIRTFCSSPKGCPGVVLNLGILRTACVENLTPFEYRGEEQAILIERLRQQFENNVEFLLQQSHNLQAPYDESLLMYQHPWPPEERGGLCADNELASYLLGPSDVTHMLKTINTRRGQILEDAEKTLVEIVREASAEPEYEVPAGSSSTLSNVEIQGSHAAPGSVFCSDPVLLQLGKTLNRVENKLDRVNSGVKEVKRIVLGIKDQLGQIISIQDKLQTTAESIMFNVDRIVGFSHSLAEARTPRRPYFTKDDVTRLHKATATLLFGEPIRLHFMCESAIRNHFVEGQAGFALTLTEKNKEWLTRISVISFKILVYSLKAGLQVTVGLGKVVPGFNEIEAALPLQVANFIVQNFQPDEKLTRTQMNEAWSCMRDKLEPQLQDQYCELFRMHKVKYRNLEDGGYAWLCKECLVTGLRNNTLDSVSQSS